MLPALERYATVFSVFPKRGIVTIRSIFFVLVGIITLVVLVPRLRQAINKAKDIGLEGGLTILAWSAFTMVAGVGFGVWGVRAYWQAIPPGDYSMGGMIFLLLVIPVFIFAFAGGGGLLTLIGTALGSGGRLIAAAITVGLLYAQVVLPIQRESAADRRKEDARTLAHFESNLSSSEALKSKIRHAPPGFVPDMLEMQRDKNGIHVTNVGDKDLVVNVLLVVPNGRQFDRCWTSVDEEMKCGYSIARDGTQKPMYCGNPHPKLAPGQTKTFVDGKCDKRFVNALLEYRVRDVRGDRELFRSDSGFVPDDPKLGK